MNEFREYAIIAAYLYVCFTAILYFKATILRGHDIPFAPFGLAAAKALICAKFVSLGYLFRIGERFKSLPLIWPTIYKALTFVVLLLALNLLEEVVVGLIHHRSIVASLAQLADGSLEQLLATSFLGFLIFIPFFAFRTLGELVGERNLVRVFLQARPRVNA
jgi:hypothetical protein